MSVQVKDILQLDFISEHLQLVAGDQGIDREITFITSMEAPDFYEWVSGGEFVLTTWYCFHNNPEMQIDFFTKLAQKNIAAVGIKINRFIEKIPDEIIAVANEYNIPLFAVKRETKFREVIQTIAAEINNSQANMLWEVEKHYREISQAALARTDFDTLLNGLSRRLKCSCLCFGRNYELFGVSNFSRLPIKIEEVARQLKEFFDKNDQKIHAVTLNDSIQVFPCYSLENLLGFLVLTTAGKLPEKYLIMAEQLRIFLALKLFDRMETEQKMLNALIEDILFNHRLDEKTLHDNLELFGLKAQGLLRIILIKPNTSLQVEKLTRLCYEISDLLKNTIFVCKADDAILITGNQAADPPDQNPGWLKKLKTFVDKKDGHVTVSVGPAMTDIKQLDKSYQIAKRTLEAGQILNDQGVLYYQKYLAYSILFKSMDMAERDFLMRLVINPIIKYDEKYNSDLLHTLKTIIIEGDVENVAKRLHIHVNTVRYRLNKIKSITNYDFFTSFGQYVLTVSFLLYHRQT